MKKQILGGLSGRIILSDKYISYRSEIVTSKQIQEVKSRSFHP